MARTKVQIEISELQSAIDQLEATKPFSSPHKLYEAIAQTNWARGLGATPVMIYLRVKEVNVDPSNPAITMRVKPARRVGPRDSGDQGGDPIAKPRRGKATVTFSGLDLLMEMFRGRGIEITGVEQLLASSQKSDEENRAINLAWSDLRAKLGIPKQAKKTAPIVNTEETPIVPPSPPEPEPVVTEPAIVETVVSEEMPDGAPVQPQMEVEPSGEWEITPEITPEITLEVTPVEPEVQQAQPAVPVAVVAPRPIQVTTVRPVPSRPVPVRSAEPPRPMPIKGMYGETRNPTPWGGQFSPY